MGDGYQRESLHGLSCHDEWEACRGSREGRLDERLLGAKMETWFRDPVGARSVLGKNPASYSFYVTKDAADHGQVDAITAATISSRAFLEALRGAYEAYKNYNSEKGTEAPVK